MGLRAARAFSPANVAITGGSITGTNVAYTLSQSSIPFILLSSGSVSAAGAISGITALNLAYPNAYCYFPANTLATVSAAGWYYCTFSTTTAGTAFLDTYTSGDPTIPSSPVAVTDGKGAFTGVTTTPNGVTIAVPAGSLGANGRLIIEAEYAHTSNANVKTLRALLGSTVVQSQGATSTTPGSRANIIVANAGSQAKQHASAAMWPMNAGSGMGAPSAIALGTEDTATALSVIFGNGHTTATDNLVLDNWRIIVSYKQ